MKEPTMSLELAIERCTEAVQKLTAVLLNKQVDAPVVEAPKKPSKKSSDGPKTASEAPITEKTAQSNQEGDVYQQAAKAITTLSRQKGREAALEVLATFGASKLPAVAPGRLQEVITAAEQALGATE